MEDQRSEKYRHSGLSRQYFDFIRANVFEALQTSITRRSQEDGLSEITTWSILHICDVATSCQLLFFIYKCHS